MSRLFKSAYFVYSNDGYQALPVNSNTNAGLGNSSQSFPYDMDGYNVSASFISVPFRLDHADKYSVSVSGVQGNATDMSFKLQGCMDTPRLSYGEPDLNLQFWFDLNLPNLTNDIVQVSQSIIVDNPVVPLTWTDANPAYGWVRLVCTVVSGSILLTARISLKGNLGGA